MIKKSEWCTLPCMVLHDHNRVQGAALQNIIAVFARVAAVSVYPVTMHHASSAPRIGINFHKVM